MDTGEPNAILPSGASGWLLNALRAQASNDRAKDSSRSPPSLRWF
jgi:hypothetical protein